MGFVSKAIGSVVGGIGDDLTQKNNFQASLAPIDKQDFNPYIQQQYGQLTGVQGQQQNLADALQQQMNGGGPNPAQAQFQQNAAQVAAQAGSAIGSQKGINPGLAARLIAQQQAMAGQNAAGQAATMQAQQQLAAQQQLQQQQATMGSQALNAQGIFQGAQAQQNQQLGTNFNTMQQINSGVAQGNADAVNKTTQGILGGVSAAIVPKGKAHGGMITIADALMQRGGVVPGTPMVPGDSAKNDTVHAMLSPGEVVIPRTLVEDPERAKRFIEELNAGGMAGYGKVVAAKKRAKNG